MKDERISEPWQKEENWQQAAIAAAVMLMVAFAIAAIWVIVASNNEERLLRVQIAAPAGIFGAAVVTFCTILWRGLISTRQATLQRKQIDSLSEQISASDENNLAELLLKGAELIDEDGRIAKIAAGIAILKTVATATNGKFATEAMNLLADYLNQHHASIHHGTLFNAAADALDAGAEIHRYSERQLNFRDPTTGNRNWKWRLVTGVKRVKYQGGIMDGDTALRAQTSLKTDYNFNNVTIQGGKTDAMIFFFECRFVRCAIQRASFRPQFRSNRYEACDFSDAQIDNAENFPDLRPQGCFFRPGLPPRGDREMVWLDFLNLANPPSKSVWPNSQPNKR